MAKDKERSVNPAAQQRKLEKAKALKKGKAEAQARRNEKLARKNPARLQRQIDDLKALEETGQIKPREKQILEELERDLKAVHKAREVLGDKAPKFGKDHRPGQEDRFKSQDEGGGVLGKRRWDGERKTHNRRHKDDELSSGSETDECVRRIPMPKDTPPPIPREFRRNNRNANTEPLGDRHQSSSLPQKPPQTTFESKTTYESAPQLRNLQKEATSRFVPDVVRKKIEAVKGSSGGLVEPDELDRLEREGYGGNYQQSPQVQAQPRTQAPTALANRAQADLEASAEAEAADEVQRLAEEEARFRNEMNRVQIEEVDDEDL